MDILQETKDISKKTFLSHVFSSTEEDKAEILNAVQYALFGVIPVVVLNKLIQRFIPEADPDKSSIELLAEIFIQLTVIFCGLIIIHRVITYFPSYSGFKYENLTITNVILAFLVIVLSIQSKVGIKVNIIFDRVNELWNGSHGGEDKKSNVRNSVRVSQPISRHSPSQADFLDNNMSQNDMFPPAPTATQKSNDAVDFMMKGGSSSSGHQASDYGMPAPGPMAANGVLGGSFGSFF